MRGLVWGSIPRSGAGSFYREGKGTRARRRGLPPDKATQKAIKRLSNSEATERLLRVAASALEESGEELLGGVTAPPLQALYNGKSVAQNYRDMKPWDRPLRRAHRRHLGRRGRQRGRDPGRGTRQPAAEHDEGNPLADSAAGW